MKKLLSLLLFAVPCFAQSPTVSTFSVQSSVASLPVVGETVAANITGAALEFSKGVGVQQINVLSGSVQVYMAGLHYTVSLDKVTPANWKSSGWHFDVRPYANLGVSEYNTQHIATLDGADLLIQPPGSTKFQLAGGAAYVNGAGISGHTLVKFGPTISF